MADNKIQVLLEVDDKGTASLQKFQRTVAQTGKDGERAFSAMSASSRTLATNVTALLASFGATQAVGGLIKIADTWTQLDGRLKLVTSSSAELAYVQERLYSSANTVRASYESHADLYARIARSMGGYNLSADQTIAFTEAVSRSMIVSGGTTQEASSFMVQFGQALASNRLQGEEFRAMLESNSRAVQVLTDYLGTDIEHLREMAKSGELTADILYNAFSAASKKLAAEAESMPKTVAQAMEHLKNAGKLLIDNTNDASDATKSLAGTIDELATSIEDNREELVAMFADMATGAINAATEAGKLVPVINSIYSASSQLLGLSAGEWGIIGFALLRGGPQAAALTGAMLTINGALNDLGLGLKSLGTSWKGYAESMQNIGDVLSGKRDWQTGEWIDQQSGKIEGLETKLARLQQQAADTGETFTTGFEFGLYSAAEESANLNAEIAETQAQLDAARTASALFQDGIKSAGVDVNDLSNFTDELSVETGKLSGEMGTITPKIGDTAGAKDELANASERAAREAEKLAREQARLAKETEDAGRAMIEDAAKRRELTLELTKNLTDTSDAYETLGLTSKKAYEDQVKALTDAYQRILSIEELTDSERLRLREALQRGLIKLENDYRGKVDETAGAITQIWTDLTDETQQVLHDWVENAIKMEFDSVGEAFESLAKAMLDVWIDMIAKMIAEWVGSGLLGLFTGQGLGGFGAVGGSLIGKGFEKLFGGGTVGTLAEWGLTAAGTSALVGGGGGAGIGAALGVGGAGAGAAFGASQWFGAPAIGAGATLFGEQAAAGFTASLDTAMAGGLEWAAIPGKEFFGTGASGAAASPAAGGIGAGAAAAGFAAFAGGLFALQQMGQNSNWQSITSPTLGIGVDMPIGKSFGVGDVRDRVSNLTRPDYYTGTGGNAGGDAPDSAFGADLNKFDLKPIIEDAKGLLDILANQFGDGLAALALQLDGTVASTDAMLDAAAGYDVALSSSAEITDLAAAAVGGSERAMDALRAALMSLGLSEQQTETAMLGLIAATSNQTSALYAASSAAGAAATAVSGMASNIRQLSNTPLNISVGVESYRIDNSNPYAIEHAVGGIFSSPTLIPSIRGTRHLVGEAGQAEAITPLHAGPKTLQLMHDDIKAIASRPVAVTINLDGRQIASATMPYVDAHVAAKASRNQLANRTVY
jgi:tape measure domain-containing protein